MERLILLFLFLLLLTSQINAQKTDFSFKSIQFDNTEPELKGRVRTVLTSTYENDKVTKTTVETFDAQKRRREFISHDADIEVHSQELVASTIKQVYFYNSKTRKLDSILHYDEKDKLWGRTKLIYDSKGLLQEKSIYSEKNVLTTKISYTYDGQKKEVTSNYTSYSKDSEGKPVSISSRSVSQYNEKGQLIKRVKSGLTGDIWESLSFEYDNKGLLMKQESCMGKSCGGHTHLNMYSIIMEIG